MKNVLSVIKYLIAPTYTSRVIKKARKTRSQTLLTLASIMPVNPVQGVKEHLELHQNLTADRRLEFACWQIVKRL